MEESTETPAVDKSNQDYPGIIVELAELPPGSIITEEGLARLFHRCVTSVKRAVDRGELPPPCRLFGGSIWTASAVAQHIQTRLEEAAEEAKQSRQKLRHLGP